MASQRWKHFKRFVAPRLDIPFSRDDANRFLPFFIALMVFLTGIFLAIGITVGEVLDHKRADLSQWVTIQLPVENAAQSKPSNLNLSQQVLALLKETEGIKTARKQPKQEIVSLLSPWFGKGDLLNQLPLPIILEAQIEEGFSTQSEPLRAKLLKLSPEITLDDHQYWLDHYLGFIQMLAWISYLLALLIISATIVMIIFTSKTALKLHQDAVSLLHSVGAIDDYIARQFQFNAFLLGMRGALIGTSLAAAVFFIIGIFTAEFEAPLLPALPITGWHLFTWLCLPLVTGFWRWGSRARPY